MAKHYKKILILLIIIGGVVLAGAVDAVPCQYHNVYGWAWSENVGWLSMSCTNSGAKHWMLVDDPGGLIHNDGNETYIRTNSTETVLKDFYEIENPSSDLDPGKNITNVSVWVCYKGYIRAYLRFGAIEQEYVWSHPITGNSFFCVSILTTAPPGGGSWNSWTLEDIKNLQVGVGLWAYQDLFGFHQGQITKVFVEVGYSGGALPLILKPNGEAFKPDGTSYTEIEWPVQQDPPPNYGVDINKSTGLFSGYGWADTIGWISFNSADLVGCPSGTCEARLNLTNREVSGWARACAVFADPNACSGALNPQRGGWDGWIKLRGTWVNGVSLNTTPYPAQFEGWAWSDNVIGWISFNRTNCDPDKNGQSNGIGNCPPAGTAISNYKVMTDLYINPAPSANTLVVSETTGCNSGADPDIFLSWTFNDPGDSQSAYQIEIHNNSSYTSLVLDTGKVLNSGGSYAPNNLAFGTQYWWRVKVWDSATPAQESAWINAPASFTTDPRWPSPNFTRDPLNPIVGEDVNFTNATQFCPACAYSWDFDDGSPIDSSANPTHAFSANGTYSVSLTATSGTRSCPTVRSIDVETTLPLPTWKEIPPF